MGSGFRRRRRELDRACKESSEKISKAIKLIRYASDNELVILAEALKAERRANIIAKMAEELPRKK